MPIYKQGSSWLVSVGSGTGRFRATFSTQQEALEAENAELMKRKGMAMAKYFGEGRPVVPSSGITMGKLYDLAMRIRWKGTNAERISSGNARACLDVIGWDTPVEKINQESIRNMALHFLESDSNSSSTVNRKLSSLSVMLRIAEDEGWIQRAPRMPRRREAEHRIRFFTAEEETKAITWAQHNGFNALAEFIPFAIDTGFRRGEILRLQLKDCQEGLATLHAGTTKSGKARSVPLTKRCQKIVSDRKGFGKLFHDLTESKLRFQWEKLRESMGMVEDPNFLVHTLRHTCASRLAMAGKNASFIMNWMGHSSITVSQRYMHLAPATLLEGVDALDNYREPKVLSIGARG